MTDSGAVRDDLRILWVDDDADWVDGFAGELRDESHEVALVPSIDEAEQLLTLHAFDVLILDQKIGSADRGGTALVGRLKQGTFGKLNQHSSFLFFTGSDEWVKQSDIDVECLDGFLGIEEKGEVFSDFIGLYLERAIPNPHCPHDDPAARERAPVAPVSTVRVENWQGTVTEIEGAKFQARLWAVDRAAPEYDAWIALSRLTEAARQDLAVGATVLLRVDAHDGDRTRSVRSELTLLPAPHVDKAELTKALERARRRRGET